MKYEGIMRIATSGRGVLQWRAGGQLIGGVTREQVHSIQCLS